MTFESQYFRLEILSEGVFAALDKQAGGAHSNAGIIDLGEQTLVFDAFLTPKAANDLLRAAIELTGRAPAWLIESHYHLDHTLGSPVFCGTPVISTAATRQAMAEQVIPMLSGWRKNQAALTDEIRRMAERLSREDDPGWQSACVAQIAMDRDLLEALHSPQLCLPDQTFTGRMALHGIHRSAQLLYLGPAHTFGDAVLVLPEERVAFLGDIGFFGCHPLLAHGDPRGWLDVIDQLLGMDIERFIPGHGPIGTKTDLQQLRAYISLLIEHAAQAHKNPAKAAEALLLPEPFASWEDPWARIMLEANLKKLID